MADECVVGVYENLKEAESAVESLKQSDFPTNQVSLVTAGLNGNPEMLEELEMGDDALREAAIGAGLGGVTGILAGIAVASLGGLGAVFFVGPISGMIGGGMTGAYFGAITGCGVHEHRVKHYEQLVKERKALVLTHGDPLDLAHAERALRNTNAMEVHVHAKSQEDASECRVQ